MPSVAQPEPALHTGTLSLPGAGWIPRGAAGRILLLALLLASELTGFSVWLFHTTQPVGTSHDWAALLLRFVACFAAIFLPCAYLKNKAAIEGMNGMSVMNGTGGHAAQPPFHWSLLAAHCVAAIVAVKLSAILYSSGGLRRADPLTAGWLIAVVSAVVFAGFAVLSWPVWTQLLRKSGFLWAYASVGVASALAAAPYLRLWIWRPGWAISLTFRLTKMFLSPFVSGIVANPATSVIGTPKFRVEVIYGCSGVEGVGLILVFGILWLVAFRKECRFPPCLVLLPLGVTVMFLFNAMRIAALILIGNAGFRQVAMNGFHSQAGWIAFSAVSVGFCLTVQRVPWFATQSTASQSIAKESLAAQSLATQAVAARPQSGEAAAHAAHNPATAYLLPFVAILAAGMIASAATNATRFEWAYPLRFFAAAAVLWIFRGSYAGHDGKLGGTVGAKTGGELDWKFDWLAPLIGAAVFAVWIALDRSPGAAADRKFSAALMASSTLARVSWISIRVLAAVVTVPIAEELAFRGFLMRRLISRDFDSVSFRRFSWLAFLASSVIFGVLHGGFWIAGCIAGALFALAVIRRGRIGDAVAAHATANALLAAYILTYHKWHLW